MNGVPREAIIAANPLVRELERRDIVLRGSGRAMKCLCPFHEDRNPSCSVNAEDGTWFCHACGFGGSVIDFVSRIDGLSIADTLAKLSPSYGVDLRSAPRSAPPKPAQPNGTAKLVKTYDYHDETGAVVFRKLRYDPKDFRLQSKTAEGWVWSMEGVRRVLYNLPKFKDADFIWIVEGEKDADTIAESGQCATTNADGAGKWLDSYSESLRGKDIIVCGDNDEPGKKHVEKVIEATAGTVKTARIVTLPDEFKDVSDYARSFATNREAMLGLIALAERAEVLVRGINVPVRTMEELEREYRAFAQRPRLHSLNLASWLPSLRTVRPIVPGELVTFIADTGVGKTMLLQNLSLNTRLPTLLFEVELPTVLMFERYAGMATNESGGHVAAMYETGGGVPWKASGKLDHVFVCPQSRLAPADIERIIGQAGLKIGHRPQLVLIDYVQLVRGAGNSRYERMSSVAEELKIIAKATDTIMVIASQVARKGEDDREVYLHDAKDSGSIENSSGLVIGAWREPDDKTRLWLKVLKNTKGVAGDKLACRIAAGSLLITEDTHQP